MLCFGVMEDRRQRALLPLPVGILPRILWLARFLALFVAVSAGLMHLYENEPDTLAGFLRDTIRRFVHRPNAPLPKSASEAVLQACDDDDGAED